MSNQALQNPLGGTVESQGQPSFDLASDPVRTTVNIWDMGSDAYLNTTVDLPPPSEFADATNFANMGLSGGNKIGKAVLLLGIALVGALLVYMLLPEGRDPLIVEYDDNGESVGSKNGVVDKVWSMMSSEESEPEKIAQKGKDPMAQTKPQSQNKIKTSPSEKTVPAKQETVFKEIVERANQTAYERVVQIVEGNPYWILPNQLVGGRRPLGRAWGADEEDAWRRMMRSPYQYQKYRAVEEIRMKRLSGSEVLLFDALNDKKLWVRMAALIGIAEFGYAVDLASVKKVLEGVRPDLVANYFKRFRLKPTNAEAFILRHAVKLVGEKARLHIVQALFRSKEDLSKLYLVASIYDPGSKVQSWVRDGINRLKVNTDTFLFYDRVVKGMARAPLSMFKDDHLAPQRSESERSRELARQIQLFGGQVEGEREANANPSDGFEGLNVIEIKPDAF